MWLTEICVRTIINCHTSHLHHFQLTFVLGNVTRCVRKWGKCAKNGQQNFELLSILIKKKLVFYMELLFRTRKSS